MWLQRGLLPAPICASAMQGTEEEQATTLPQLVQAFQEPAAAPELEAAAAGCIAWQLALLAEQTARLRFSCPTATAAADDSAAGADER